MGIAELMYIVIAAAAALGLVGLVYSILARRPRMLRATAVLFALGVVGIPCWGMFLSGLSDALAHAIEEGQDAQRRLNVYRYEARFHRQTDYQPDEVAIAAVKAMERAKRNAHLFGWDWKQVMSDYAGRQPRPPREPLGPKQSKQSF